MSNKGKVYNCGKIISKGDIVQIVDNDDSSNGDIFYYLQCQMDSKFVVFRLLDDSEIFGCRNYNQVCVVRYEDINQVCENSVWKKFMSDTFDVCIDNVKYLSRYHSFNEQISLFDLNF